MGFGRWFTNLFSKSPPPPVPKAEVRDYTAAELASFDGTDLAAPLLIAIRGRVYDVSRGRDFYGPGGPYGMFAGKDCTRALAKMSFEEGLFTDDEEGLAVHELDQLEAWIETFEGKYGSIGKLLP
ncbi:MAG: cytochrome b5-like heme/steroid binding domain-containing protein [Polyangiales bacterium]